MIKGMLGWGGVRATGSRCCGSIGWWGSRSEGGGGPGVRAVGGISRCHSIDLLPKLWLLHTHIEYLV